MSLLQPDASIAAAVVPSAIADAGAADLDAILAIEEACFPHPWKREFFMAELAQQYRYNRVLREQGDVVGYLFAFQMFEEMHVNKVAVQPSLQGQGRGDLLMRDCERFAAALGVQRITLEVRPGNERALAFYENRGFRPLGRRRGYYQDGEDALVLARDLQLD